MSPPTIITMGGYRQGWPFVCLNTTTRQSYGALAFRGGRNDDDGGDCGLAEAAVVAAAQEGI
jgi:hypothetical protein